MKGGRKTTLFGVAFAVLLVSMSAAAWRLSRVQTGHIANLYQNAVCIRSIDLSSVREAYSFCVTDGNGYCARIEVEPGRIRVAEANCPDRICVQTGWISNGLRPIVCLPARLCIQMENAAREEENGIDAVIG
ncbi:MAG: NusG domain II-containing protein [Oscillospiraceae bacterium]|nr:NusG domain II-containing protein [Oscillospiraceae bacterium]